MKSALITIVILTNVFVLEKADTEKDREMGMMYRKDWGNIDGMIFIHKESAPVAYWMKNTYLQMNMLFLDTNLNILESYYPKPLSLDIIYSSNTNIKYVIELNPLISNKFFLNYNQLKAELKKRLDESEKDVK